MAARLIPTIRYVDAPAAIAFLCAAFGFTRRAVHVDPSDATLIHHAELTLGDGVLMLGSARPDAAQTRLGWTTPAQANGVTMALYVVVDDLDAHFERACAGGGETVDAPHDNEGYPGRGYTVRDPEGHVWSFGSYDPWSD